MTLVAKFSTPTEEKAVRSSRVWPTNEKLELTFATRVFSQNSFCMKESGTIIISIPAGASTSYALSM